MATINFILYFITLFIYWKKYKRFDIYAFIITVYTIVAGLCLINKCITPENWSLALYPFLYLFFVLLIFLRPYHKLNIDVTTIKIVETPLIKFLLFIYILSSAIAIYYTLPQTIALIRADDWNALRNELYADADSIELYSSFLEKIAKNIQSYLSAFAAIIACYQLTKPKVKVLYTIVLFVSWIVPSFLGSTLVASRGMVAFLIIEIALCYVIFRRAIPRKRKKVFLMLGLVACICFLAYTMSVSISRFGEEEANSSIVFYLGHSMLYFNDGLMQQIGHYANGKYFFKWFIDFFHGDSFINMSALEVTFGTAFMTFIGCFYIDFGPLGTLLLALLISSLLGRIAHKKEYHLSDLVLLLYFAFYYAKGVFVVGRGTALGWLMAFAVFFILKFAERKSL